MVSMTSSNISLFLARFFSNNTGSLAPKWSEDDIDSICSMWDSWCAEHKDDSPFTDTPKGRSVKADVVKIVRDFAEIFGAAIWAEGVWDTLNKDVYSTVVEAVIQNKTTMEALDGALKKTVRKTVNGKKEPSNRNKSAYLYCCEHFRSILKAENPACTPQQLTKLLGERWKLVQSSPEYNELHAEFLESARVDKERYEALNPKPPKPVKVAKPAKVAKPKGKPRGKSAWLIFCQTMRPGVKTEMPEGATNKDVMAKLGEMWASTGFQDEKIKAVQESMEDKRRVEQLLVETNIVVEDETETTVKETTVKETTVKVAPPVVKTPVKKVAPPVVKTPSAPVKAKAKEEEDTLMSMKTKLSILLSGDDDESEDEDEPLGGVVLAM